MRLLPDQLTAAEAAALLAALTPLKTYMAAIEGEIDEIEGTADYLATLTADAAKAIAIRDAIDPDAAPEPFEDAQDAAAEAEETLSTEQSDAVQRALSALTTLDALALNVAAAQAAFRAALDAAIAAEAAAADQAQAA